MMLISIPISAEMKDAFKHLLEADVRPLKVFYLEEDEAVRYCSLLQRNGRESWVASYFPLL
jgi:hypothetical protein